MPVTDGLHPPNLPPYAKDCIKACGGWTGFMQSHQLKPYDDDDNKEAEMIVRSFAEADAAANAPAEQGNGITQGEEK